MSGQDRHNIWKNNDYVKKYIEDFRGAIPYAIDQIEIMLEAIAANNKTVKNFADLGCGNGILTGAILLKYPEAYGTLVDFHKPVLEEAKHQLLDHVSNLNFVTADFASPSWVKTVRKNIPFDVIVSGYTIHHLVNKRKKEIYAEIFKMLKPGGIFINIEEVLPEGELIAKMSGNIIVKSIKEFNKKKGIVKTSAKINKEYNSLMYNKADILVPAEVQLKWLSKAGFKDVGVFFRAYIATVFGGVRPKAGNKRQEKNTVIYW